VTAVLDGLRGVAPRTGVRKSRMKQSQLCLFKNISPT
jgi:hypothetical protein